MPNDWAHDVQRGNLGRERNCLKLRVTRRRLGGIRLFPNKANSSWVILSHITVFCVSDVKNQSFRFADFPGLRILPCVCLGGVCAQDLATS